MATRLTILVAHPSALLTDHRASGDGLVAHEIVRRLALRGHRLHVAAQRVDLREPLPESVHLHRLGVEEDLGVANRLRYMYRLRRLFERLRRSDRLDLVHQLNPVDAGLSLALPADPPVVLGPYVPDWPPDAERDRSVQLARVARRALREGARRVVRARQQSRAALLLLSSPAAEVKVHVRGPRPWVAQLPPGIDPGAFKPAAPVAARPPTVLYLANLHYRKGIITLLDAHERLVARLPQARLLVAGSGEQEPEVRRRVAASPARDRIELLGAVEHGAVGQTMARADVYCLPSYGEPFGISALEAMACGLPVVGTDAGGLAHLIREDGGLKVPPRDARRLADALLELLEDPARRAAMGRANRLRVEREYAWDVVLDRLEELYRGVMAASSG